MSARALARTKRAFFREQYFQNALDFFFREQYFQTALDFFFREQYFQNALDSCHGDVWLDWRIKFDLTRGDVFPGTVLPKCAAFFREQYFQNALRFSGNSTSKMRCVFSGKVGGAYRVIIELQSGNLRVNLKKNHSYIKANYNYIVFGNDKTKILYRGIMIFTFRKC